ncbi:leucyl aminopeptidase [Candidatus Dependentiae bacterium]|nr:leucyl aminopeptidase [Candidatus Dependentiae bacterium]
MITLTLNTSSLLNRKADAYVFFADHAFDSAHFSKTAGSLYSHFDEAIKTRGFTGAAESSLILTGSHNKKGVLLIFIGLGDLRPGYGNVETYRRALGNLIRIAESHKLASFTFDLPDSAVLGLSTKRLARETSTMLYKAGYHFDEYITNQDRKFTWDIEALIGVDETLKKNAQEGVDEGMIVADAINSARYWCDMPPSDLTPPIFAEQARVMAEKYGLKSTIFNKEDIVAMKMGGIEGVSRGSVHEPRLVILEHKATRKDAPTIAIVGKGVTFDSGGICIKPCESMITMKDDMAGAGVVLATMRVIAQLKPEINVIAIAPLVENMPSGTAQKPGDILRTYNGKTIEVVDTDAEGRLILADGLAYAVDKYKPDALIDLATLTGACAHALGVFYAGLFTQHDDLARRLQKASEHSGDRICRLPMDNDYKPAISSDIADVKNVGSRRYMGGAITAAFFLQAFTGTTPWAHLDIAGVAFGMPDRTYFRPGATGFGIRLLTDLIMHWYEDTPVKS